MEENTLNHGRTRVGFEARVMTEQEVAAELNRLTEAEVAYQRRIKDLEAEVGQLTDALAEAHERALEDTDEDEAGRIRIRASEPRKEAP